MDRNGVDVAVVGGGACGVMTALRASLDDDLVVGVFEKSTRERCNAEISSGSLAAGGTRFQRDAGIDDSPEKHAGEILAASGDGEAADLVHALCAVAPAYVEWIADLGYPVEIGTDMPRAGMSVPRLHTDVGRRGGGRLTGFLRSVLATRDTVAFVDDAPVVSLLVDGGAVTGVVVDQNGVLTRVRAGTTVLATGGFAGSADLMRRYCAALGEPLHGGVSTNTGDAVGWLVDLGADLRNMGACLRHGLMVAGHGTRLSPALPFYGAVLLDPDGRRFVDEHSVGYSALAGILQGRPGETAAMVWDEEALRRTRESELMRESIAAGAFRSYDDEATLAAALRLSPAALADALAPLPGRRPLAPPYYHAAVTHGVLTTQGGAAIDSSGRVLRGDGDSIPGLRAGGGAAVGLAGPDSAGYSSGNGLLSALGMGWIIGNALRNGGTTS